MIPRRRYYVVVAVCGAVLMALEILSSRLLAPQFGNSVYVWGSIISVFLAALSLGYWLGGGLADRAPRLEVLAKLILLAAVGEAVLLGTGRALVEALGELTGGAAWGTLVATTVLFGPVSVLVATASPFTVRLAARDVEHVGNTAGRLYAVSTAGSLVGTLGCTFGLIPFLEIDHSLALLTLLTVAAAFVGLAHCWRQERATVVLGLVVVVFALSGVDLAPPRPSGQLAWRVTPYQTLQVIERQGARYLRSDRVIQSGVRLDDGLPAITYPRYLPAALLWKPNLQRVLVLGMGAGTVGTYLRHVLPHVEVDFVDVDPAVPELAERYLGFRPGAGLTVHLGDARRYLARSDATWDVIYCDTYIGAAIPFHLTTLEFFRTVRDHLEPDGVLGVNLAADLSRPFPRAIYLTITEVFATVEVFEMPPLGNILVLATSGPTLAGPELPQRAAELDRIWSFDPTLVEITRQRAAVDLDFTDALILRDTYAPVNWMVRLAAEEAELPETAEER